ncbi:MAG: hypothetical protein QXO69_03380, partial [archaeon]
MVSKTEMLQMIHFAMNYEERFLPELSVLMNEKIQEYRLPKDKELEAKRLLNVLVSESSNHFRLLEEAFLK